MVGWHRIAIQRRQCVLVLVCMCVGGVCKRSSGCVRTHVRACVRPYVRACVREVLAIYDDII